ncbi:MAG: 1-acyl-sn-glycerol-3-phosphate acyltransferase [Synergistaceae bacterium]|jgi:1-acyl-sn-glycerol-3-phosphate acyltransferase|nr:1-acyl-sn-glycerol-3-phosphate acyltransferase [Synergistaceae bacterium]
MLYRLARFLFWIYFLIYHRIIIRGMKELKSFLASLPPGSPVILAANHESYLDPPAIGMAFPGPLRFVAWDGLFKSSLFAALIRALGAVPVSHENKNSAAGLLRTVIGFIEDGYSVLIFPEGERTPDGELRPLEGGVALMASKTGAPVVPVWIDGTWEAYPVHYRFPRPRRVTLTFGTPILLSALPSDAPEKDRRRMLLESIRSALETMRDSNETR